MLYSISTSIIVGGGIGTRRPATYSYIIVIYYLKTNEVVFFSYVT